jgi:hypothetical protein
MRIRRVPAIADGWRSTGFEATSRKESGKSARPTGIKNVVYFGVQLVLISGLMLLTALVLLEIWQSAKRPLPLLLPLTIARSAQLLGTAVRPSAGLLRSAPSRAPPPDVLWTARCGQNLDMVFRDDPLIW